MSKAQELTNEQAQEAAKTKRKRNRPDLADFGNEHAEPGDNSRFLRFALASWDLPPIDISDPKQVEQRIKEYLCTARKTIGNQVLSVWEIGLALTMKL